MKEIIELSNKDLNKDTFKNLMFFSIAEGGAMGEPGGVVFLDKNAQSYHFNYVFGDIDMNNVETLFPVLAKCNFGMFGHNSSVPKGWNYVNLGMGNHLIVNDEVYPEFKNIIGDEEDPAVIYGRWIQVACDILGGCDKSNEKSKIELLHASCADQNVDAVVNAANDGLWAGGGICGVIFNKAGMKQLTLACNQVKTPLKDGEVAVTPSFNMKNAKIIIHAVGPNFNRTPKAFKELFDAYYNSLVALKDNGFHSISFPLISSSTFGGNLDNPVAESTKQCCRAYQCFIKDFPDYIVDVKVCAYQASEMVEAQKVFDTFF